MSPYEILLSLEALQEIIHMQQKSQQTKFIISPEKRIKMLYSFQLGKYLAQV